LNRAEQGENEQSENDFGTFLDFYRTN
jgi:hypothetical protein